MDILNLIEQNKLPGVFEEDLQSRLAVALFQACFRPMLDQKANGSWNDSIEETAYAVLILSEARRVCFFNDLRQPLDDAIKRGVAFINSIEERPLHYIWIEKVSYASRLLTDAYVLGALKAASSVPKGDATIGASLWKNTSSSSLDKHVKLFSKAELFSAHPEWELTGSMIEAVLLKPLLLKRRLEVFQRQGMQEDKYFDLIPLFWTSPNNRARTFASATFLYEVSLLSMLTYQVDEFMEASAAPAFKGRMFELRKLIYSVLPEEQQAESNGTKEQNGHTNGNGTASAQEEVLATLKGFKKYCFENPLVKTASAADQKTLERELRTYLLAQVQQEEDSAKFRQLKESGKPGAGSTSTFYSWARSTGADNVSGPFAWAFIGCLLSSTLTPGGGKEVFPTAGEKYVAADVYRHLATMARIYNDLGSIRRDQEEGALNSVNFPEFESHESVDSKKNVLHKLGEYEFSCLTLAFKQLEDLRSQGVEATKDLAGARLSKRRMNIWSMFLDQVVLFDQIYVIKDLSSHHIVQEKA